MKDKYNDIGDDEIRVLGDKGENQYSKKKAHHPTIRPSLGVKIGIPIAISLILLFLLGLYHYSFQEQARQLEELDMLELEIGKLDSIGSMDPSSNDLKVLPSYAKHPLARETETGHGFIEITDTVINDIPLRLYLPHQVNMSLH